MFCKCVVNVSSESTFPMYWQFITSENVIYYVSSSKTIPLGTSQAFIGTVSTLFLSFSNVDS